MKFAHKVAVAFDLSEEGKNEFSVLKQMEFLNQCEVHFVHVFQTTTFAYGMGDTALIYPIPDDRESLEESIVSTLKKVAAKIFPEKFQGKVLCHCLFSDNPKKAFCDFVVNNNIDLVLVAAREKRGTFESSFTHYVTGHTKSNIMMLKHHE
jgi:nucleotide-binding universal stress UspA family protein